MTQTMTHVGISLLPLIFAGVRTALVEVFASATLAARIGAGGLGVLLMDGLRTMNTAKILWGSLLSAGLAIFLNRLLKVIEERL